MATQNVTEAYVIPQTAGVLYNGNDTDQTYSINPNLIGSGEKIVIVDQGGQNSIELVAGLEIVSSQVIANQAILTLSNGAVVDIRGANTFTFNVGQNTAAGDTEGTERTFADFAQNVLGVTVPAEGVTVPAEGGAATINDDGTAGEGDGEGEEPTEAPSEEPTDPSVPGESFTLTAGVDTIEGTTGDDTIEASASSLSSGRTLNAEDSIDGGEGNDTLAVDLLGNFSGFSKDGGVTNVETIELTNEGSINRSFDATGVEGDVNYVVNAGDATVNLIDVGSAAGSVTLNNQADGLFSIAYATDATKGTSDNLALNLNAVGTVDDASTSANEEKAVAITAAGVESATVSVTGDNVVDLNAVAATSYTVEGEGSLKVTDVANGLTSFDASALAGDLDLAVDTDTARKNATIAGGEGNDTVRLDGSTTTQYTMAGVESLVLANTGALTVSAANVSGLESITATGSAATLAGLGNADLTLNLVETATAKTTLDNSGTTTVNVADAAATSSNTVNVTGQATLTKSTAAVINVAENVSYAGTVVATQAESVTVAAAGKLAGAALQASNATAIVINQVDEDSVLNLTAGKAEQLTVNAAADLDLSTSTLSSLQVLDAEVSGNLTVGPLAAISTVNVNGTGEAVLGALGSTSQDGYGITINAGALSDGDDADTIALNIGSINTKGTAITVNAAEVLDDVTIGAINANNGAKTAGNVTLDLSNVGGNINLGNINGKAVTVDASDALGTVTNGTITATDSVNYSGTVLKANNVTIVGSGTSFTGVINGGIDTDNYIVDLTNAGLTKFNLSGDLGIQGAVADKLSVNVNLGDVTNPIKEVAATYNVAGVEDLTFSFDNPNATVKLTAHSSLAGATDLTVTNGTLDVSALANANDFAGIANVDINSGLTLNLKQLEAFVNAGNKVTGTGELTVKVASDEEVTEVQNLLANINIIGTATVQTQQGEEAPVAKDVSGLKGAVHTVDLSEQAVAANASYTLTLAKFDADNNNKSDLTNGRGEGAKSDFTVILPALEEIKGELKIVNMTISMTTGKPNDVVNFADSKAELLAAIESITVKAGTATGYTTLEIDLKEAGSIVLENVINSKAEAVEADGDVEAVTWAELAGSTIPGIIEAGVISNEAGADGVAIITGLVDGLVDGQTFVFDLA